VVNGAAVHDYPAHLRYISPLKIPVAFALYDTAAQQPTLQVAWSWPIHTNDTYYLNIRNMENAPNRFYLEPEVIDL
jgi:hypothetical protein